MYDPGFPFLAQGKLVFVLLCFNLFSGGKKLPSQHSFMSASQKREGPGVKMQKLMLHVTIQPHDLPRWVSPRALGADLPRSEHPLPCSPAVQHIHPPPTQSSADPSPAFPRPGARPAERGPSASPLSLSLTGSTSIQPCSTRQTLNSRLWHLLKFCSH